MIGECSIKEAVSPRAESLKFSRWSVIIMKVTCMADETIAL